MSKIAIIPARGGSKRIPGKNIKPFIGKPVIAYSIEAAITSGLFDTVMVSTDVLSFAEIAKQYGAEVPFLRSDENSNDFASTVDVIIEVLDWYKTHNRVFESGACIYPCAPFITKDILKKSFNILSEKEADCVFPIIEYGHPIQRALKYSGKGPVTPFDNSFSKQRTQDLEKAYYDAGMFYTFNTAAIYKNKNLRTDNTFPIEINELNAHDIDSEDDWELAELKYKRIHKTD
jgi:N-acylneuraminate cytidylyltransferase